MPLESFTDKKDFAISVSIVFLFIDNAMTVSRHGAVYKQKYDAYWYLKEIPICKRLYRKSSYNAGNLFHGLPALNEVNYNFFYLWGKNLVLLLSTT